MLCVVLIRLVAFVGRKLLNVLLLLHQNSCKLNMDILIYDKANLKSYLSFNLHEIHIFTTYYLHYRVGTSLHRAK